jgi:nucleotide-binding universal stress UspA family protein
MKTVLAPIDFSAISDRVIASAISLARAVDARLVLLNIVAPVPIVGDHLARSTMTGADLMAAAEQRAAKKLAQLQRQLRDKGVTAHAVHGSGDPAERILEQAERLTADYIVIGSHGHSAIYDLLVGSTANGVLKGAACPVVVVPVSAAASPRARQTDAMVARVRA